MTKLLKRVINSQAFEGLVAFIVIVGMFASIIGGAIVGFWALRWWVLTVVGWLPW